MELLKSIHWSPEPTPEARRERLQNGNGYLHWLKLPNFDPAYIYNMYLLFLDQNYEAIIELSRRLPVTTDKRKSLEWISRHYAENGIDPLDIRDPRNVKEKHFLNAAAAMPLVMAGVMQRSDFTPTFLNQVGVTDSVRWFQGYHVWKHGSQTFKISPALAIKLLLTEIQGLTWEDFHLPFPSFVLQVPSDLVTIHDPDTGEHPLDTIMITESKDREGKALSFLFLGQENANSKGSGDDAVLYINLFSEGRVTLEESLNHTLSKPGKMRGVDEPVTLAGDRSMASFQQVVRFALNVITYINSRPADVVRDKPVGMDKLIEKSKRLAGKKRERILQKMKELRGPTGNSPFVVGSHVVIDKNLERIVREGRKGEPRAAASVATYVRGHWTHQVHGPARSLRRLQWIEPYWRNLDAEPGSKDYTVK